MSSGVRKLVKSESQPVIIPLGTTGGTQIYFPDNQYIRNKKLMGLCVTTEFFAGVAALPGQLYVDGTPLVNDNEAAQIYLTMESYAGVQFIRKRNILDFNNKLLGSKGTNFFAEFIGQKVNWPKCYIEIANGAVASTVKKCVLFDIEFTELNAETVRKQLAPTFGQKK